MIIISPHSDDAIFSLGRFVAEHDNITIVSPFMGIPSDEEGKQKHMTLKAEHKAACDFLGAKHVDGEFLDDVYAETRDIRKLPKWLESCLPPEVFDDEEFVIIPLGIHHPDHVLVRKMMDEILKKWLIPKRFYYVEQPYGALYPPIKRRQMAFIRNHYEDVYEVPIPSNRARMKAIAYYGSQLDEALFDALKTDEITIGAVSND